LINCEEDVQLTFNIIQLKYIICQLPTFQKEKKETKHTAFEKEPRKRAEEEF